MTGFQLTERVRQIGGIGAPALRAAVLQKFVAPAQLALMHVRPARKGAAMPADDRDIGLGVEVEAPQCVGQMPHQIIAEGVQPVRPVQSQGRDPVAAHVLDQAAVARLGHLGSPRAAVPLPAA